MSSSAAGRSPQRAALGPLERAWYRIFGTRHGPARQLLGRPHAHGWRRLSALAHAELRSSLQTLRFPQVCREDWSAFVFRRRGPASRCRPSPSATSPSDPKRAARRCGPTSGSCPPSRWRRRPPVRGARTALDRAAYDGSLTLPSWVISGTADAARQILTALAAAVITVVGVVFSITIVALTLASTQFGPRMLRNFIRDRGTQVTLGTFVATFVYAILALGSIGHGPHGDFVPHLSITVTLALVARRPRRAHLLHPPRRDVDPAAAGHRRHRRATCRRRSTPSTLPSGGDDRSAAGSRRSVGALSSAPPGGGAADRRRAATAATSSSSATTRSCRSRRCADAVDPPARPRPGTSWSSGHPLATVWPADAAVDGRARASHRAHVTGPQRTLTQDLAFADRPARRDRDPRAVAGGQRHVHRADLHRLARRRPLPDARSTGSPAASTATSHGYVRVITAPTQLRPARRAGVRQDPPGRPGHARGADPPARRARARDA